MDRILKRRIIRDTIIEQDDEYFGSVDDIIKSLTKLRKDLRRKYREYQWFELESRMEDWDSVPGTRIVGCRWETDEEFDKRVEKAQQTKLKRQAKLVKEKPYVCPHCKTRYKEPGYIRNNECPACVVLN